MSSKITEAFNLAKNAKEGNFTNLKKLSCLINDINKEELYDFFNGVKCDEDIMLQPGFLSFLIELGLDIVRPILRPYYSLHPYPILMSVMSWSGTPIKLITLYLEHGADVNLMFRNDSVLSFLSSISEYNIEILVKLFLKHGLKRETFDNTNFQESIHHCIKTKQDLVTRLMHKAFYPERLDSIGANVEKLNLKVIENHIDDYLCKKEHNNYHVFFAHDITSKNLRKEKLVELLNKYNNESKKYKFEHNLTPSSLTINLEIKTEMEDVD